jgi:hypothetical protein
MEGELIIRKVYVDSRFRSEGSNSDFTIDLKQNIETPPGTVAFLDDVTIPHTWYSVANNNRYLYIAERAGILPPYVYTVRQLDIPQTNYNIDTYREALESALNSNLPNNITATYIVAANTDEHTLTIAAPLFAAFHFLSDKEIEINDSAHFAINKASPQSGNNVIRNFDSNMGTNAASFTYSTTYTTGWLDFLNVHDIYIHSSLCKLDSLGPNGQTGILAKCPVSQSYGNTIHERLQSEHDYTDVGLASISQIKLSIRDAHSNLINLNNSSWSATIIFRILN